MAILMSHYHQTVQITANGGEIHLGQTVIDHETVNLTNNRQNNDNDQDREIQHLNQRKGQDREMKEHQYGNVPSQETMTKYLQMTKIFQMLQHKHQGDHTLLESDPDREMMEITYHHIERQNMKRRRNLIVTRN